MKILLVVFFAFLYAGRAKSQNIEDTYGALVDDDVQNDEYGDYEDSEDGQGPPDETNDTLRPVEEETVEFLTQAQVVIAKIGDVVRLPCDVSNPDVVIVWQKDGSLIFQGHIAVSRSTNLMEFPNNTLEVNVTSSNDFGNYACILITSNEDDKRPQLLHKIVPLTPPQIMAIIPSNNRTEYQLGETLNLTCKATGYPKPDISWHLGNERLDIHGETLTIPDLKVENGGIYRCLADNKVTKPSHHHIEIHVEHAPIVKTEKYIVTSDKGEEAELTCTVDAYPAAHIVWKRNGENLVTNSQYAVKLVRRELLHESILTIRNLNDDSFGTYTCLAKNSKGKQEKKVSLVRTPAVREFVKPERDNKDVVLTWRVESKTPISMHEIQYRKKGEAKWSTAKPEVSNHVNNIYLVTYTLKDLEAGNYETRMRSKNNHGWSEFSDIMPFEGVLAKHGSSHKPHHKKHHKEKEQKEKHLASTPEAIPAQHQEIKHNEAPVGASQHGGCGSTTSSATVSCIALLFLFFIRQ
ncbi:protein amalgam isoform X2 [Leptinotarsa decemlineata]|uniref:protein amalgam isoform X2 n=1 Tax=Leptinotarsa decemlineata TaxID=7539 RepID=UPI003D308E8C